MKRKFNNVTSYRKSHTNRKLVENKLKALFIFLSSGITTFNVRVKRT